MRGRTHGETASLPRQVPRWLWYLGALFLVTLIVFAWSWFTSQTSPRPPQPPPEDLFGLNYQTIQMGTVVLLAMVPAALLYILGNTPLFRNAVSAWRARRDRGRLLASLAVIQLLSFGYSLMFARLVGEPPEFGFFALPPLVVVAGGLLGGWRVGLGLGLLGALLRGTQLFLRRFVLPMTPEMGHLLQSEGLRAVLGLPWGKQLLLDYLKRPATIAVLWVGVFAGLVADALGRGRFALWVALLLGVGVEAGFAGIHLILGELIVLDFALPAMVVVSLTMVVVALTVRGVQAETALQEAAAADLARTQAELRALRAQINPHFLFNALNTIRYFVRTDPQEARQLLLHLSEIFQRALRSGQFVRLRDELGYVEAYLALEQARLGERLRVVWHPSLRQGQVEDSLLNQPVPTLILQPLVENAVLHGIAVKPEGGTVSIVVERTADDLVLQVEDDGPGISPDRLAEIQSVAEEGQISIGLRNVRGRLRALYGEDYGLIIESHPGQGTRVGIRIPVAR